MFTRASRTNRDDAKHLEACELRTELEDFVAVLVLSPPFTYAVQSMNSRALARLAPMPAPRFGDPDVAGLPFYLPGQSPRSRAAALRVISEVPPVKVASRATTPRSSDVSYLADHASHHPSGGPVPLPPPRPWEGQPVEYARFKRSIAIRRNILPAPPALPPTWPPTSRPSTRATAGTSTVDPAISCQRRVDAISDVSEPRVDTMWLERGYASNEVARLLFPGSSRDRPPLSPRAPARRAPPTPAAPASPFSRPITAIELYGPTAEPVPSGRAKALELAKAIARDAPPPAPPAHQRWARTGEAESSGAPSASSVVPSAATSELGLGDPTAAGAGDASTFDCDLILERSTRANAGAAGAPVLSALSARGAAALRMPTNYTELASVLQSHEAILQLEAHDVAPQVEALDGGYKELIRQVGSHCTEHAMILEYLRRQHLATAACARALLGRLQHAVGQFEELREAMDGSMLRRFEDSLVDALAAALPPANAAPVPKHAPAPETAPMAPIAAQKKPALRAAQFAALALAPSPTVLPVRPATPTRVTRMDEDLAVRAEELEGRLLGAHPGEAVDLEAPEEGAPEPTAPPSAAVPPEIA